MKIAAVALIAVLSVFSLIILFFHIKSRRPLRSAAINALIGIGALLAVNLTARFTGVGVPVNIYTLPGAAVFGLPACVVFVVLSFI